MNEKLAEVVQGVELTSLQCDKGTEKIVQLKQFERTESLNRDRIY